jgi:hypothetical protein
MVSKLVISLLLKIVNLLESHIVLIFNWLQIQVNNPIRTTTTINSTNVNPDFNDFLFIKTCKYIYIITIISYKILLRNK